MTTANPPTSPRSQLPPLTEMVNFRLVVGPGQTRRRWNIGRIYTDRRRQAYIVHTDGSFRRCTAQGEITPRCRLSKKQRRKIRAAFRTAFPGPSFTPADPRTIGMLLKTGLLAREEGDA